MGKNPPRQRLLKMGEGEERISKKGKGMLSVKLSPDESQRRSVSCVGKARGEGNGGLDGVGPLGAFPLKKKEGKVRVESSCEEHSMLHAAGGGGPQASLVGPKD